MHVADVSLHPSGLICTDYLFTEHANITAMLLVPPEVFAFVYIITCVNFLLYY